MSIGPRGFSKQPINYGNFEPSANTVELVFHPQTHSNEFSTRKHTRVSFPSANTLESVFHPQTQTSGSKKLLQLMPGLMYYSREAAEGIQYMLSGLEIARGPPQANHLRGHCSKSHPSGRTATRTGSGGKRHHDLQSGKSLVGKFYCFFFH